MTYEELMKLSPKDIVAELRKFSDEERNKLFDSHPDIMDVVCDELYKDGNVVPTVFLPELVKIAYRDSLVKDKVATR